MQVNNIVCDRCKHRISRPVYVDGGEYCAPCAIAIVSDRIRYGHTNIMIITNELSAGDVTAAAVIHQG